MFEAKFSRKESPEDIALTCAPSSSATQRIMWRMIRTVISSGARVIHGTQIRLARRQRFLLEVLELLLCDVCRHGRTNDHTLPRLPVHGSGEPVIRCQLQGGQDAEYLLEIPPGSRRVNDGKFD